MKFFINSTNGKRDKQARNVETRTAHTHTLMNALGIWMRWPWYGWKTLKSLTKSLSSQSTCERKAPIENRENRTHFTMVKMVIDEWERWFSLRAITCSCRPKLECGNDTMSIGIEFEPEKCEKPNTERLNYMQTQVEWMVGFVVADVSSIRSTLTSPFR